MFLSLTWYLSSTDNCQSGLSCWYMVRLSGDTEPNFIASCQKATYDVSKSNQMFLSLIYR